MQQKAPLKTRSNPEGTTVTFMLRQPEWWPTDFVENPDGSAIAFPPSTVAQIRPAAPDNHSTAEALVRAHSERLQR